MSNFQMKALSIDNEIVFCSFSIISLNIMHYLSYLPSLYAIHLLSFIIFSLFKQQFPYVKWHFIIFLRNTIFVNQNCNMLILKKRINHLWMLGKGGGSLPLKNERSLVAGRHTEETTPMSCWTYNAPGVTITIKTGQK